LRWGNRGKVSGGVEKRIKTCQTTKMKRSGGIPIVFLVGEEKKKALGGQRKLRAWGERNSGKKAKQRQKLGIKEREARKKKGIKRGAWGLDTMQVPKRNQEGQLISYNQGEKIGGKKIRGVKTWVLQAGT